MRKSLPQLKAELLKEIGDYLESKGVKKEDLKQRIKELKLKSPPDLRYNLLVVKDYYERKKAKIVYDKEGVAIPTIIEKLIQTKNNQEEKQMGDRVELQKKIDALKKLNKAQLVNIAKEGRYMGVKFEPFTIAPGTDTKANVKSIAYELQDAMGLGSDKAKANQGAESKPPATKTSTPATKTVPAAKKPTTPTKETSGEITPLSRAKEALRVEKEKSKAVIDNLKAKGKEDLAKAAEKLSLEKEKGKTTLAAEKGKSKLALDKVKDKTAIDLLRGAEKMEALHIKLSLSIANERNLFDQNKLQEKNWIVMDKEINSLKRLNAKLKTDLAKAIKFLEKLI